MALAQALRRHGHTITLALDERYRDAAEGRGFAFLAVAGPPAASASCREACNRHDVWIGAHDGLPDWQPRIPCVGLSFSLPDPSKKFHHASFNTESRPFHHEGQCLKILAVSRYLLGEDLRLSQNETEAVAGFLCGDSEDFQVAAEVQRFLAAGGPPVSVVCESEEMCGPRSFLELSLDGIRKAGRRAIVYRHGMPQRPDDLDPSFCLPLSELNRNALAGSALVIHQGSDTSSMAAYCAGIPAIIVPSTPEQNLWAQSARMAGCAKTILPISQLNAARLSAAIQGTLGAADVRQAALRLAGLIQEENGVEAAVSLIEEFVSGGSSEVLASGENIHSSVSPLWKRVDREGPLPLSFAQQRLWFLHQLNPAGSAYNMPLALRLRGPLHAESLQRAITLITSRHEALRTTFPGTEEPVQKISTHCVFPFHVVDLRHMLPEEREAEAMMLARKEAETPFDLQEGPLLRVGLLQLGEMDYVWMLNMHHIVSDGWSVVILMREITQAYEAYARNSEPELPVLEFQYADFAAWQRQWLQGSVLEQQLAYWREQLAGAATLELPVERPRKLLPAYDAAVVPVGLPGATLERVKKFAQQEGITLFMTLLAGFQLVLSRYSASSDIAVGTAIANRRRKEMENIVGFFVNTLVLRTGFDGNLTLREAAQRTRKTALDAYRHQDIPFEKLVQDLHPERLASTTPFFQAMLIMENTGPWDLKFAGVELEAFLSGSEQAKFELTLALREEHGALAGELVYARELYGHEMMQNLARHWTMMLEAIATKPETYIADLSLLTDAERAQMLAQWNNTAVLYPAVHVHTLVERQAALTPNAVAVEFEELSQTYQELEQRAQQLSRFLFTLGIGPEARVALCLARGLELPCTLLGILKAGAAYVPLDPAFPEERLAYMIEDSQADILLTDQKKLLNSGMGAARVIDLRDVWASRVDPAEAKNSVGIAPENLAYIIYTSGSTGRPKGVQVSHGALSNFLFAMKDALDLRPGGIVLAETPLSFDIAALELYLPLCIGARLRIVNRETGTDAFRLVREANRDITLLQATPATWNMLLETGELENRGLEALCGGEALPQELARKLTASAASVWNMYGPTETTVWSLMEKLSPGDERVSIGKPVANTRAYVVDEGLQLLPAGIPGELLLGGSGLARGYWRRPDLTAERFIPDPFYGSGERLYRTGDRVRWLPEGKLEYLGRTDFQIKIRGHRIEPGEIEAVLNQNERVGRSVVMAREDALVAYIVGSPPAVPIDIAEIKAQLRKKLPEYMVPDFIIALDHLPLTPNGKIDRNALPKPQIQAQEFVAPRNQEEEVLCRIWAEVLSRERVGVTDRFFDLGGHSLLATQVMTRVRASFHVDLPLQAIFEAPTIAELAEKVRIAKSSQEPSVPLVRLKRKSSNRRTAVLE